MINRLFQVYRRSPFWLRELLGRASWPLRLAMTPLREIRVGGYAMTLDFLDNASFKYFADRERYEAEEVRCFLASIAHNPGCVVVDVGANYGAFTLPAALLAKLHLAQRVIAIEPDRRPCDALRRSVHRNELDDFVDVHQVIVGDAPGKTKIFVNARSSADNRTHHVGSAPIRLRASYDVECVTIDDLLAQAPGGIPRKLIIKMDIQGNEPRALRGMSKTLAQADGWILFFEHAPYLIESTDEDPAAHERFLETLAPDEIFQLGDGDEIHRLDGLDAWRASLDRLHQTTTEKTQGVGTNYAFVRGLNSGGFR